MTLRRTSTGDSRVRKWRVQVVLDIEPSKRFDVVCSAAYSQLNAHFWW